MSGHLKLFIPGPVEVHPEVLKACSVPMISHRAKDYEALQARTRDKQTDAAGNTYVADTDNHLVRKISAAGAVTTLAGKPGVCGNQDGAGSAATLCRPASIAVDKAGNVYVAEVRESTTHSSVANPIRKIAPTGEVTTLTSKASQNPTLVFISGPAIEIYRPVLLATDSTGVLYAADPNDHVIRRYAANSKNWPS